MDRLVQMHGWLERITGSAEIPAVNVLMVSLSPREAFAGQTTAVQAGFQLAIAAKLSLRFIILRDDAAGDVPSTDDVTIWLRSLTPAAFQGDVSAIYGPQLDTLPSSDKDLWVATHWMTASTLNHFLKGRGLPVSRAVYVIQDFEPAFAPWSSSYAISESTYNHGFIPMVNSSSLADYLEDEGHVDFARSYCFSPAIDSDSLRQASLEWTKDPNGNIRVLFYGRPSHPRNLFEIGVEALRTWIDSVDEKDVQRLTVVSAGTDHAPIDLGRGVTMTSLGKTSLETYYKLLSRTDMALALMHSPHPGHLSLELPVSGIPTVTNSLGSYRTSWTPQLLIAEPDTEHIAEALATAHRTALQLDEHEYRALEEGLLGSPLDELARNVLKIAQSSATADLEGPTQRRQSAAQLAREYRALAAHRAERITSLRKELASAEKTSEAPAAIPNAHDKSQIRTLKRQVQVQRRQLRRLNKLKSVPIVRVLLPIMHKTLAVRRQLRKRLRTND